MTLIKKAPLRLSALIVALAFSVNSYAGKIYMWFEEGDPNPKYGEIPPKGVDAKLISDTKDPEPSSSSSAGTTGPLTEEQKKMRAQREADCSAEQQRLATLESSGSRIRMANPDGTSRYLTPDEVLNEIEMSKTFLKDACGK